MAFGNFCHLAGQLDLALFQRVYQVSNECEINETCTQDREQMYQEDELDSFLIFEIFDLPPSVDFG